MIISASSGPHSIERLVILVPQTSTKCGSLGYVRTETASASTDLAVREELRVLVPWLSLCSYV